MLINKEFPYFQSIDEVIEYLSLFLNLKGCEEVLQDSRKMRKLVGRKRIASLAIKLLSRKMMEYKLSFTSEDEDFLFKCNSLEDSINEAYDIMKIQMIKIINQNLEINFIDDITTHEKLKK